jgi:Oxaloacetate decarboxylase, gamma chain.
MNIPNIFLAAADTAANIAETIAENTADIQSVMDNGMTTAEKVEESGKMFADGMGTVFLVLIVLWGIIALFKVFFYDIPNKKAKAVSESAVPAPEQAVAPQQQPTAPDDSELIAVITAAVAAYIADENGSDVPVPETSFRVVSFKRMKNGGWNKA